MALEWDDPVSGVVGLDAMVLRQGGVRLDNSQRAIALLLPSTAAETVTAVETYMEKVVGSPTFSMEVFDLADPFVGAPNTQWWKPIYDAGFSGGGGGVTFAGVPIDTSFNRYQNVDDMSDADYIELASSSLGVPAATWDWYADTSGGITGNVTVFSLMLRFRLVNSQPSFFSLAVLLSDTPYTVREGSVPAGEFEQTVVIPTNPATGQPWTEADIVAFDVGSNKVRCGFFLDFDSTSRWERLSGIELGAEYLTDYRQGVASATVTADGKVTFTLGSDWSKDTSPTQYLVIIRRTSTSGSAVIPTLDTGATMPGGLGIYLPILDATAKIATLGTILTEFAPIQLALDGGGYSVDSQPYVHRRLVPVDATHPVMQETTRPGSSTIGWFRFPARSQRSAPPAQPLTAAVKTSGGGLQIGGDATFGPELVADEPRALHVLDETMAATAGLTNGTQYERHLTSTAPAGQGWEVVVLDALTMDAASTMGGTTDRGKIDGVEQDAIDVVIVDGTVPATITGLNATADNTGSGSIVLDWNGSSLAGDFERYELERSDDGVWRRIAAISTEADSEFTDYTARHGAAETYRVVVRATNGTKSLPSATASAMVTAGGSWLIPTDDPASAIQVSIARGVDVGFARDRSEVPRSGGRFPAVTTLDRDRGVTLDGTIHRHVAEGAGGFAKPLANLRALLDATDRFVLLSKFGERWIVAVDIQASSIPVLPHLHEIPVRFVEVADIPDVVVL